MRSLQNIRTIQNDYDMGEDSMTDEDILKSILTDIKENQTKQIPENDIPAMSDLIVRKVKIKEIIYADMVTIYTYLPMHVKKKSVLGEIGLEIKGEKYENRTGHRVF